MLPETVQDLRYAGRLLLKAPGFSAVAVLTLALGLGAGTALFTVINAVILQPLPYVEPERLVTVWQDMRATGGPDDEWATPGNYVDWRQETALFDGLAVVTGWRPALTGDAEPEALLGEQVSHEYFSVLGVAPALGRAFSPDDDAPASARVVMISDTLWRRRFGADPTVVGRSIRLGGEPHQVVGVLPPGFRPIVAGAADVWRPLRLDTANPQRGAVFLRAVGRLAPGVSLQAARTAASGLARRLEAAHPEFNEKTGITLIPLHERVVGDIEPALLALTGAVTLVLLIACANVANLLLARGTGRARELAVRRALGAGRGRIAAQLLTESVLLAVVGGLAGLIVAVWLVDGLVALAPDNVPRLADIRFDPRVLGFAAALAVGTGLLFGLAPALQRSGDLQRGLREGARGGYGTTGRGAQRVLVAMEVALAIVLLAGGTLLVRTFNRLQGTDLGFDPSNVLVGFVNPPRPPYDSAARQRIFYDQVLEKAGGLPGVERAALSSVLPLGGDSDVNVWVEGAPSTGSPSRAPVTWYRLVSAGYFDAMGMRIVRGRTFPAGEAAPSVVVNETFARRLLAGGEPLGRRIRFDEGGRPFTIVGVVADARARGAREEPQAETYVPYWQMTEPGMNVILKADGSAESLAGALRRAVAAIDPNVPVSGVTTLGEMVGDSIEGPRFLALLSAGLAALALGLAALGIYGVMAYAVAQRSAEIGVRMALGATPGEVFRLIIVEGLSLTAAGIAAGAAGAVVAGRALESLLFGVTPGDPVTLGATTAVLVAAAAAACIGPARRATRVDPLTALRAE